MRNGLGVRAIASILIALASVASLVAQQLSARAAPQPIDAVTGIVDALRTHDVVTVTDAHGSKTVEAFWAALLRDRRLPGVVDDIVMESGNSRFQAVIDRYVDGEDVPYDQLQHVWNDATVPQLPGPPGVVPNNLRIVREVNRSLPRDRRLRVLLGEPPIDWSAVRTREDHQRFFNLRDSYPAALIVREVLAQGRHALLMYGQGHAQRRNQMANYDMSDWRAQTIVSILEQTTPARVFTILHRELLSTVQDVSKWPVPSLAIVRGTTLGAIDYATLGESGPRAMIRDGRIVPVPKEQWRVLPMEEQFDAVLHLGPEAAADPPPPASAVCADRAFVQELLRRMEVGAPPPTVAAFRRLCDIAK
jgi:hypothetical protein